MSSQIKVINNAKVPIHGALSWFGIQQQCFNELQVGKDHVFEVGLGSHDLTIVVGSQDHKFNSNNNNSLKQILLRGLVLTGTPIGLGIALAVDPIAGSDLFKLGVRPPGAVGDSITVKSAPNLKVFPVTEKGLYAPHGYDISITGGDLIGKYDKATKTFTITEVKPLRLHWENKYTNNSGETVAPA